MSNGSSSCDQGVVASPVNADAANGEAYPDRCYEVFRVPPPFNREYYTNNAVDLYELAPCMCNDNAQYGDDDQHGIT